MTLPEVTPAAVTAALQRLGGPVRAVRLLSDVTAAQDARTMPAGDLEAVLALHDLLFLTVQAASDTLREGGTLATCLLGALPDGEVHPLAGIFTGFVKSAAIEMPGCLTYAVLTSARDAATGIAQTGVESTLAHDHLPVAIYDGDRRCSLAVRHAQAPLDEDTPARLGPDSVVLATGGSRGITAVLLKALAARHRPAIYVLGTTDLDGLVEPPSRPDFMREQRARHPGMSVAEMNRGYERLQDALTGQRTLAELRGLVGEDRVRYLRADVRDGEAVAAAVRTVLDEAGHVDLVLHTAGINRSALIASKRFEDFRAVRDIKVVGHHNLKRAFGGREPAMWCNFSSLVGVTGQVGETDYAAGNDFLATASRYAARVQGADEFALGWSLWSSVGLGADPVKAAFLERGGAYTGMDPAEGVHHFLRELHLPAHDPSILYMGEPEETALLEYRPGTMPERAPAPAPERGRFFVGRTLSSGSDAIEIERTFDLERDAYLAEHVVLGHPTLPGTFVTEIAAEAATALAPGRMPVAFEDVVFSSFLRVYRTGRPAPKRIHARVLSHDDSETVVRVRIATDVVSPAGIVLTTDKTHFEITVRLRDEMPAAPHWEHWPAAEDGRAMPDPYHMPNPAVLLTGSFVSTRDTRLHALGRRAELALDLDPGDPRFAGFIVPAIMLDGLVRVSVLDPVQDGYVTLAAPAAMRRIDLYEARNDIELAAAYPTLSLYSAPRRVDLEGPVASNRCVAVAPDGHVVAQ
ncbi:MAG: SDR family NAD(P)-dependent oxidoreductase, partial [Solirubrobacteraceae bacterium]